MEAANLSGLTGWLTILGVVLLGVQAWLSAGRARKWVQEDAAVLAKTVADTAAVLAVTKNRDAADLAVKKIQDAANVQIELSKEQLAVAAKVLETAEKLSAKVDKGTGAADQAFVAANSHNAKIVELENQILTLTRQLCESDTSDKVSAVDAKLNDIFQEFVKLNKLLHEKDKKSRVRER